MKVKDWVALLQKFDQEAECSISLYDAFLSVEPDIRVYGPDVVYRSVRTTDGIGEERLNP